MVFPYLRGFDIEHLYFTIFGSILRANDHEKWFQRKCFCIKGNNLHFFAHFQEENYSETLLSMDI